MKDNFDDIIKNKWEQFHFPVDEDHRRDMISLLDQNKRRKTGLFWWIGGIGSAIVLMAVVILISSSQPTSAPNTEEKPVLNSSGTTEYAENEKTNTELKDGRINEVNEIRDHLGNEHQPPVSPQAAENDFTSGNLTNVQNGNTDTNVRKSPSSKPKTNKTEVAANNNNVDTGKVENLEEVKVVINPQENKSIESTSTPYNPRNDVIINEAIIAADETGLILRENIVTAPVETLPINLLDYTIELDGNFEPAFAHHHALRLFAESGVAYVPGVNHSYSSGWTFNAGGGLDYEINNKFHLTLSSGYLLQKGGFKFEKSSTVQQNSFGLRSNFNTLTPDKLHFVYAKAGIHYRVRRHIISLSGGAQYLYGAQGEIVTRSQDQLLGLSEDSKYSWLNIDGMQRLLWNAEAQYGYQITPLLSLRAGVKYTFTPLQATDTDLADKGYYWNGAISSFNPFFTIHFNLYGKR